MIAKTPQTPPSPPYAPQPTDTSDVALPPELLALAEQMARHVHEVWAEARIHEGWTYGPRRDDALRQTPCLVPYDELTDEERAYDLRTALATLRLIVKLGFTITKQQ